MCRCDDSSTNDHHMMITNDIKINDSSTKNLFNGIFSLKDDLVEGLHLSILYSNTLLKRVNIVVEQLLAWKWKKTILSRKFRITKPRLTGSNPMLPFWSLVHRSYSIKVGLFQALGAKKGGRKEKKTYLHK